MGEAAKKDDDEKEEKFVPVGPGADELPEEKAPEKAEPTEDERLAQKENEEPEERAARPKETSKERRERAKKTRGRERAELEELRRKNLELERRFVAMETRQSHTEGAAVDQRINSISGQIATARRVMADALKAPNGTGSDQYEEALKIYDELRDQLAELKASKKEHVERSQEQRTQPQQHEAEVARPDPRVVRNAREWASQHAWFQFDGEDEDSRIVRAIDESLAGDGFDPMDEDYWQELTARVKRRLPERFKKGAHRARPDDEGEMDADDDEAEVRTSGPKFSSGGRERPLKKGEVYVSAERKAAMKEYGVWEDKAARNRMLKKYAEWDASNSASRR